MVTVRFVHLSQYEGATQIGQTNNYQPSYLLMNNEVKIFDAPLEVKRPEGFDIRFDKLISFFMNNFGHIAYVYFSRHDQNFADPEYRFHFYSAKSNIDELFHHFDGTYTYRFYLKPVLVLVTKETLLSVMGRADNK